MQVGEVRIQFLKADSFLPLCGFQGLHSGLQSWQHSPSPLGYPTHLISSLINGIKITIHSSLEFETNAINDCILNICTHLFFLSYIFTSISLWMQFFLFKKIEGRANFALPYSLLPHRKCEASTLGQTCLRTGSRWPRKQRLPQRGLHCMDADGRLPHVQKAVPPTQPRALLCWRLTCW